MHLLCLLLTTLLSPLAVSPLTVRVKVPPFRQIGEDAELQCQYDLEPGEVYSVQWYKESEEFFRYKPRSKPQKQLFKDIVGVRVDIQRSGSKVVILNKVSVRTAGNYRCEVSGEAPHFPSAHGEGKMEVISIPKDNPVISGTERQYEVGDTIALNCTSGKSHPASKLQWFINDEQVLDPKLLEVHSPMKHSHGLYTSALGLRFTIHPHHFRAGSMVLRCVATVSTELWRSHANHEVHDGEAVRVLENREAFVELKGSSAGLASWRAPWLALLAVVGVLVVAAGLGAT